MTAQSATTDGLSEARHAVSLAREKMIAEAAYYRAEWRGFSTGDPPADWLASEAKMDTLLVQRAAEEVAADKQSLLQSVSKNESTTGIKNSLHSPRQPGVIATNWARNCVTKLRRFP